MSVFQTLVAGAVMIGMATALLLPDRKTPQVIDSVRKLFTGTLSTAITGR